MAEIRGSQFPGLYDGLKYIPEQYGYVLLDLDDIPVTAYVPDSEDDLYYSPTQKYIQGAVAEKGAHVTLLGGLLQLGSEIKPNIDIALSGWSIPSAIELESVGYFPSSIPGEDYNVIVAHVKVTDDLKEGNDRLRMLPHVDYFPVYKPHFTLAYVKPEATTEWIEALSFLRGERLPVNNLNYGD